MSWIQISFQTTSEVAGKLSDALSEAAALSVTLQDAKDQPLLEPGVGETPVWDQVVVTGLFNDNIDPVIVLNQVRDRLSDTPLPPHDISRLEEKAWEREWMKDFHPMRFGERTWVCPSWLPVPDSDAVNIMLDPGLAFGTGTHPTTALCLEWLDQHIYSGMTVVDFGCGSGILAIAAARLGASKVWAIDNDPQALVATRDNATSNSVEDIIHCYDVHQTLNTQADVLIANILANPLISLESLFKKLLKKDGLAVLSGILSEQADEVIDAYAKNFELENRTTKGDWCRLDFRRL